MADAPTPLPTATVASPHRFTVTFWPVFAWLAIQMLALMAAGLRVPFSARFPAPEEQLAVQEMLVAQTAASALLFPVLFPTVSTALLVIASTPAMLLLAAGLAAQVDDFRVAAVGGYVTAWVVTLAGWAFVLRSPKARLYGIAVATFIVLGGAVLAYLIREFGAPTEGWDGGRFGWLGPLVGSMAILERGPRTGTAWEFLGAWAACAAIAMGVRGIRRRKPPSNPESL